MVFGTRRLMGMIALTLLSGCTAKAKTSVSPGSSLSSFTVSEFVSPTGSPSWTQLAVALTAAGGGAQTKQLTLTHDQFHSGSATNVSFQVLQGIYTIALNYSDASSKVVYQVCSAQAASTYNINTPQFTAAIPICVVGQTTPTTTVQVTPTSSVTLVPKPSMVPTTGPGLGTMTSCTGQSTLGFDLIYGNCIDRATAFYTQGGDIYAKGTKLRIKGINWFGLEGSDQRLDGLWTGRTMQSFVDQMAALGFNAFRLPVAPESLDPTVAGKDNYPTVVGEIQAFLAYTASKGMYVLLDMHNCSSTLGYNDKPGPGVAGSACAAYTEAIWTTNLQTLAGWASQNPNVIGIDMFNEPFGLTWTDWSGMVSRASQAVLTIDPTILLFVEGVGSQSPGGADPTFWGENLVQAGSIVPTVPASRLVYSPHVYGPSVSSQPYFQTTTFPTNMPAIWDSHFGYLQQQGFTVAFGEFGGQYVDQDKVWQDAFVSYFVASNYRNFFYWCLNPNSGDTKGLLEDDWQTVNPDKLRLLQQLLIIQP